MLLNLKMDKNEKNVINDGENVPEATDIKKGPSFGQRHIQAILLFLCVTIEMMTRSSISLFIVAMTDNTTSTNPNIPTYDWKDTNIILSSFYWGYVGFQVLAGQLSKTYGAKWILFGAMGFNSLALTGIPFAAKSLGSKGVMMCRIIQGLCQGGLFPCCHTMLGRWAPENERGRMSTFIFNGMSFGTIICLPITGIISKSYLGWPVTCYLFGGLGLAWCALWSAYGSSNPAAHPFISVEERQYIESSLNQKENEEVLPTPWKEIFTSIHFWACFVSTIGSGFGIIFLQNEMPTYLGNVMGYDIKSSGYLTSMTGAVGFIISYVYGISVDLMIERKYVSQTNARRILEFYSCFGSAVVMLVLAYIDKSQAHMSIFLLTLASAFGAGILYGHGVNPIDLSPRFSGIILALCNSTSCVFALTAPLAVQFIVTDESNASEWRIVFIIAAAMYAIPALVFVIFVSGERQWWDDGGSNVGNTPSSTKVQEKSEPNRKISRKISSISQVL